MILKRKLRRLLDKYHQGYYIEKYIINDGKKHPMAIICPGGGYHWVCSFSEGMPYAKKLNSMGYSAFVIHYRCGKGYEYPIPQEDLARAIREILSNSELFFMGLLRRWSFGGKLWNKEDGIFKL